MTMALSTTSNTKPEPVRIFGAVITGLQIIAGGITLVAGLQHNATIATCAGIAGLVIAGANAAKDQYLRGQVTPSADVLAYLNDARQVVTGPATAGPARTIGQQNLAVGLPEYDISRLDELDGVGKHEAQDADDGQV